MLVKNENLDDEKKNELILSNYTFDHNGKPLRIRNKKELDNFYNIIDSKISNQAHTVRDKRLHPETRNVVLYNEDKAPQHFSKWKFG